MRLIANSFISNSKRPSGTRPDSHRFAFGFLLCVITFAAVVASCPAFARSAQALSTDSAAQAVDPNKAPSEFNHHIAGWALIGVGLLALTSFSSTGPARLRYLLPAIFVLAGVYLAVWSDGEIWPRGNLNWLFLLQHDAEARQHKIYAILLVAIGVIEYLRIRGSLPQFWKKWAFPLLAVIGASMLLFHDHTGGSGARSPEAQAYLVDPALDVDGKPRIESSAKDPHGDAVDSHHPMEASSAGVSSIEASTAAAINTEPMEHAGMTMGDMEMGMAAPATAPSHHHVMSASMLLVEREHMWFLIVGLAIGLFKFVSDGEFFRNRIASWMWPTCMLLLGFMLVFYRE